MSSRQTDTGIRAKYAYDDSGRLWCWAYAIPKIPSAFEAYTFAPRTSENVLGGSITKMETLAGNVLNYTYDHLGRLSTRTMAGKVKETFGYKDGSGSNTTTLVSSKNNKWNTTDIQNFTYQYDALGRITQEKDTVADRTTNYTYDVQGQLLTATTTGTVSGTVRSGNPISYYNGTRWTFAWQNGRRLASAGNGTTSISYTYDLNGLRTGKTVGTVEHRYVYASGLLLRETYGNVTLDFSYGINGTPYSMTYTNGSAAPVTYYYITNLQNDVIYMVTESGTKVAEYSYDPYGKVTIATGSMANINPLRYRGYYYDTESGDKKGIHRQNNLWRRYIIGVGVVENESPKNRNS